MARNCPSLFLHPKHWNKQVVIWVDEAGKAGLFGSDGSPKPEVRATARRGLRGGRRRPAVSRRIQRRRQAAGQERAA